MGGAITRRIFETTRRFDSQVQNYPWLPVFFKLNAQTLPAIGRWTDEIVKGSIAVQFGRSLKASLTDQRKEPLLDFGPKLGSR